MFHISYIWAVIYTADIAVVVVFARTFLISSRNINIEKHTNDLHSSHLKSLHFIYISWFAYTIVLGVKVVAIFSTVANELKETDFFGPNTLKTSLALAAVVFITFVPTLNDIQHGTRKDLIVGLTSTVTVDILDGVDNLEVLFDVNLIDKFPESLGNAIIIISCINFLIPIVPLFILAQYTFGLEAPSRNFSAIFRFVIVYLVNLPLLVLRLYIWHGLSQGISMFMLKNMIAMGVVTFELLEKLIFPRREPDHRETNGDTDAENLPNIIRVE